MKTSTYTASLLAPLVLAIAASAQSAPAPSDAKFEIARPKWQYFRFNEDWSSLKDAPADSIKGLDSFKYIPLSEDGDVWLSLGGHTRARFEAWDGFGFGAPAVDNDEFVLWRAKLHADLHVGENLRFFVEGKSAQDRKSVV